MRQEGESRKLISTSRGEEPKDSATALSQQFPLRLMLWTQPCLVSCSF